MKVVCYLYVFKNMKHETRFGSLYGVQVNKKYHYCEDCVRCKISSKKINGHKTLSFGKNTTTTSSLLPFFSLINTEIYKKVAKN